jgi:hypothetical protein
MMKTAAPEIRLFEWINMGTCAGHPHNLTEDMFDKAFPPEEWERKVWNTGVLRDFGGTATNNYIALHLVKKTLVSKLAAVLPSKEDLKKLDEAGAEVRKAIMDEVDEKMKE